MFSSYCMLSVRHQRIETVSSNHLYEHSLQRHIIGFRLLKTMGHNKIVKSIIPVSNSPGCLLKSIESFLQVTNTTPSIFISFWLLHIDIFLQTIQECCLHIKLYQFHVVFSYCSQNCSYRLITYHRRKCLEIIYTLSLAKRSRATNLAL